MYPEEFAISSYEEHAATGDQSSAAKVGELPAFEEIFERYHAMVYHLACRVLGDREEALDIAQEVFFTVYRRMGRFRGEASLKTWIYRIAVNKASNRFRWWNRLRRRGSVSLDEHLSRDPNRKLLEVLQNPCRSPEDDLLLAEERINLEKALLQLPLQQRIAVVMRDIEGMTYEEIAEANQVSLGTVKSRIARGRGGLKQRLNGSMRRTAESDSEVV